MKIQISAAMAFMTILFAVPQAAALDADMQVHQFRRDDVFRLETSRGNPGLPDDIRTIDRIDIIGYQDADFLWTIDRATNQVTYKRYKEIKQEFTGGTQKKSLNEVLETVRAMLFSFPSISTSFYEANPIIFKSTDLECKSINFNEYCDYPNSVVVFYPYLFQGLPVYDEKLLAIGLVAIVDEFSGEVAYMRALSTNETEAITLSGEQAPTQKQPNAYILNTRLYDHETYLIPAVVDGDIQFAIDLTKFGFSVAKDSNDPVGAPVDLSELEDKTTEELEVLEEKKFQIKNLKVTIPQSQSLSTKSMRTSRGFSMINLYSGKMTVGQLVIFENIDANQSMRDTVAKRSSILFQNRNYSVYLKTVRSHQESLKNTAKVIRFEE
jgi:hypothetical protein